MAELKYKMVLGTFDVVARPRNRWLKDTWGMLHAVLDDLINEGTSVYFIGLLPESLVWNVYHHPINQLHV